MGLDPAPSSLVTRLTWIAGLAGGVLLLFIIGWLSFGGAIKSWYLDLPGAQQEGRQVLSEIEAARQASALAQQQVQDLNQKIRTLTAEANQHRANAARALERERLAQADVKRLEALVERLQVERRALVAVRTRAEAYTALKALGY